MVAFGSVAVASTVFQLALAAWLAIKVLGWVRSARAGNAAVPELAWVTRDWRPFVPLMLALVVPGLPGSGLGVLGPVPAGRRRAGARRSARAYFTVIVAFML